MVNKCAYTVWPGILSNAGIAPLSTTGFALQKGESRIINAPSSWGGRFWGRTHCSEDSTGKFSCVTGDCGSGKIECAGNGAVPPATLAEFTLDGDSGMDFYDVSLVDGYNLPMLVLPQGGSGVNCTSTGCMTDLNGLCPSDLRVKITDGEDVACKSACLAFGKEEYCCNGAYSTPDACKPSSYSQVFKSACPHAYSYAYDDKTSTFTCAGADYFITFCPSPNTSKKSSSGIQNGGSEDNTSSLINNTMVYEGASQVSGAPSIYTHLFSSHAIAFPGAVALAAAVWRLCYFEISSIRVPENFYGVNKVMPTIHWEVGNIVATRIDTNLQFYGDPYLTTADILLGTVDRPKAAEPLVGPDPSKLRRSGLGSSEAKPVAHLTPIPAKEVAPSVIATPIRWNSTVSVQHCRTSRIHEWIMYEFGCPGFLRC
ncbi:unnamed protein product [Fraxinus pennsylvanica]|uniref:Thaumatin-like protein n=1 Tax=Fraxinus pennsylvanica TaxID=56036 RepID=A0AAD1YQX5_9LAMI|nr:unnamed protein product [Fraxinus pennsylvanica]